MRTALNSNNTNQSKGSFDGPTRASTIDANDKLRSAAEYRSMVLAYRNGAPVRLTDVADVVDDAENVKLAAWANNQAAIIVNIQRQPGANVIQVVDRIKALLPEPKASCRQRGSQHPDGPHVDHRSSWMTCNRATTSVALL